MKRAPVDSEAIASVGYEPAQRMLEVEFTSGALYRYLDVPNDLHVGLMAAESHGEYFTAHLRDAGFHFERLR